MPFENSVDLIDLRGDHLLEALEYSVASDWHEPEFFAINMLQMSGECMHGIGKMWKAAPRKNTQSKNVST